MSEGYEVVIAGAGPAGAQCARDLAARDYDVAVLETESEDEFPRQSNKSTGGTFPSMMASFGIPDEVVMQFTDTVVLESPNDYYVTEQAGAVLEFADFKRFLVRDGRDRGADYIWDARVSKPVMADGEIVGVRYNGDQEIYGDLIIDATGPAAPLAKALGVSDLQRDHQAIGVEFECEGVELAPDGYADLQDAMMLRLDHQVAPGGYSWIFHTGADTAKVGLCYIQNESHQRRAEPDMGIDDYLDRWQETDPRLASAERIETKQHRGSAHIQAPGSLSTDNFIAIGDTVPTVDPVWGEGIHKGMKSGRGAAVAADHCLMPGDPDTSAENIAIYNELWHAEVAPNVNSRLLLTELLYLASDERYDRFMEDLNAADQDTLAQANEGNKLAMLRLLHLSDLPTVVKLVRRRLAR